MLLRSEYTAHTLTQASVESGSELLSALGHKRCFGESYKKGSPVRLVNGTILSEGVACRIQLVRSLTTAWQNQRGEEQKR